MSFLPATSADLAAWVQAIGSILAILAAIFIARGDAKAVQRQLGLMTVQSAVDTRSALRDRLEVTGNNRDLVINSRQYLRTELPNLRDWLKREPWDRPPLPDATLALNAASAALNDRVESKDVQKAVDFLLDEWRSLQRVCDSVGKLTDEDIDPTQELLARSIDVSRRAYDRVTASYAREVRGIRKRIAEIDATLVAGE